MVMYRKYINVQKVVLATFTCVEIKQFVDLLEEICYLSEPDEEPVKNKSSSHVAELQYSTHIRYNFYRGSTDNSIC